MPKGLGGGPPDVRAITAYVDDAVMALRGMSALRAAQSFLRKHGLSSGRAWEELASRFREHITNDDLDPKDLTGLVIDLRSRLGKLISVYNVSKEVHKLMWAMALQTGNTLAKGNLSDRFPWTLPEKELEELGTKPRHVFTRTTAEGVEMIFTSARVGKRIDEVGIEDIAEDARTNYSNADRIYAERIERVQAFDIIFIPRNSRLIQIRVDARATTGRERADEMKAVLETVAIARGEITALDFVAINLFPAIRSIYDDADVGRVNGLQFDCSTGTNRREVMRKVTDETDLRREPYHVAGVNEVDITLYWLSVDLEVPDEKYPERIELVLPGTIRNLQGQPLTAFEVSTFASESAIGHAVEVLFDHVKPS